MSKLFKSCVLLLFLTSSFSNLSAENKWITKKSLKSKEEIKEERATKTEWIKFKKKEIKKNKKEYKEKEKNISKKVKSWITKKSKKDQWLSIYSLPDSQIYFTASSSDRRIFYGYIDDDKSSELLKISNSTFYKFSNGMAFINDGKTTCRIGTERGVIAGRVIGFVSGECTDKTKFTGQYGQRDGSGSAQTEQKEGIAFKFNPSLLIAKNLKENLEEELANSQVASASPPLPRTSIEVKPTGKYHALLIGNSNYTKWASLTSPKNDVDAIAAILKSKYSFETIIKITDTSREEIYKNLHNLEKISKDTDYVLIYYGGHGQRKTDKAYWIPKNGGKNFDHTWVSVDEINNLIKSIKAQHILLMTDSCYFKLSKGKQINKNNKQERNAKWAASALLKRARLAMTSGSDELVVDTFDGKNSKFAKVFIEELKGNTDYLTSEDIFSNIQKSHTNLNDQTPQFFPIDGEVHGDGQFIFKVKN